MKPPPQPLSGAKHFMISFTAAFLALPASVVVFMGGLFVFLFFVGIFLAVVAGTGVNSRSMSGQVPLTFTSGSTAASDKLVVIPVQGPILSGSAADSPLDLLFSGGFTNGDEVRNTLYQLADDPSVRGVMLLIDSPGGMIPASHAIADGVATFREQSGGKPIVAHINGSGTSGAYWAAISADTVTAEPGSESGSIGVILGVLPTYRDVVSLGDVATRQPIEFTTFSAGRGKDIGNPFRPLNEEEKAVLQTSLDAEYDRFVRYVAERRGIDPADIRQNIAAYPYDNTTALSKKLLDSETTASRAIEELAKRANISDYGVYTTEAKTDFFGSLFSALKQFGGGPSASEDTTRQNVCRSIVNRPLVYRGDLVSEVCR